MCCLKIPPAFIYVQNTQKALWFAPKGLYYQQIVSTNPKSRVELLRVTERGVG